MTQSHGYLDGIESGAVLREASHLAQVHEEFTTSDEAHDEENLLVRLEHVAHTNQKRVVSLQQDVLFQSRGLHLIILNDDILSQGLHGVNIVRIPLLDQKDFSEGATTDDGLDHEVRKSDICIVLGIDK